jgi:hypothetical protein
MDSDDPTRDSDDPTRRPSKEELRELGKVIATQLKPLESRYPGFTYAMVYGLPRVGMPDKLVPSIATNQTNMAFAMELLVHGAKEVKEQFLDPYVIDVPTNPLDVILGATPPKSKA